jgi:glyoxylase-like metal-dependent hydrolase (beta-lactamase superfamily II)
MNLRKVATQLSDTIWFVQALNSGRYPYANSILINDHTKCIIDLGVGGSVLRELTKKVKIDKVVFSHCHEDHTAGSSLLPEARFYAHRLDVDAIESIDKLKERYLVRGTDLEEPFDRFFFEALNLKNCHIDKGIEDKYIFDLGNTKLGVIHTPGHSAGHCCFSDPSSGVLFASDVDLSSFGPWYGCADSDIDDFISSINKLMSIKAETLVSSHKGIISGDVKSKLKDFLEKIFERERRLVEFLGKPRKFTDIVNKAIIYGKFNEPKEAFELFESVMIKKHLERLVRCGSVTYEDGKYVAI